VGGKLAAPLVALLRSDRPLLGEVSFWLKFLSSLRLGRRSSRLAETPHNPPDFHGAGDKPGAASRGNSRSTTRAAVG
jgi:hypothetical protein